ncbi:MAG: M67 family metallopeptidase [Novosphingobium sp.]
MDLVVTSGAIATMLEEAARAAPAECCGLLLGSGAITEVQPAANVAADPSRHFEIDPVGLIAAHRKARAGGPKVLGYYHSHPNGLEMPSATDSAQASEDGRAFAIVANGRVRFFLFSRGHFEVLPTRVVDG